MRHHRRMADRDTSYLSGTLALLKDSHVKLEALFTRFEEAADDRTKREIVVAALYELRIHATIEELMLHPAVEPELIESAEERREVERMGSYLETMTGKEHRHDRRFAALAQRVRRHILEEEASLCMDTPPPAASREPHERRLSDPPARAALRLPVPAL
jgi:hypothetical protein